MPAPLPAGLVLGVGVLMGQAESGTRATGSCSRTGKPVLGLASPGGASGAAAPAGSTRPGCDHCAGPRCLLEGEKQRRQGRGKQALFLLSPWAPTSITQFPSQSGREKIPPSGAYRPPPPLPRPSD